MGSPSTPSGRVWFANYGGHGGHGGVSFFDPKTEQWKVIPGTTGNLWRSVAVDDRGPRVGVQQRRALRLRPAGDRRRQRDDHQLPHLRAVRHPGRRRLDGKGKVWMIDYNGWTWQMDPMTFEKKLLPVANVHYTYSDFTGSGLSGIVPQ
jgi:streptogramin lyase